MKRSMRFGSLLCVLLLAAAVAFWTGPAHAASAAWTGGSVTDSLWSSGANWDAAPVPGTGNTATFNGAGNGRTTIDLGGGVTVGTIVFDTNAAAAYTIGSGVIGAQALTLDDTAAVTMNSTVTANELFHAAVTLGATAAGGATTVSNDSISNTLNFAGDIAGGGGGGGRILAVAGAGYAIIGGNIGTGTAASVALTKSGGGTLALNGANTFSGGVTLSAGTLNLGNTTGLSTTTALGAGMFAISGGTLDSTVPSLVNANNNAITIDGDFTFAGTNALDLGTGAVSLGAAAGTSRTITVSANALTLGGPISDGATANVLVKAGDGALVLKGANLYTGTTRIDAGTLQAGSTTAFGPAASASLLFGSGSTGTVQLNGNSMTVIGLNTADLLPPSGAIVENSGAGTATLTVNNATDNTFAGALQNGAAGTLALTKTGAGKLTLSGANTYTGKTSINGGILSARSLAANNTIAFNNGGILEFTGASGSAWLDTGSGSNFNINVTDAAGNFSVARNGGNYNPIIKGGAGTLTLANTGYMDGGDLTVNDGTAVLAGNVHWYWDFANVGNVTDVKPGATLKLGNATPGQVYYNYSFHMSGGTFDLNGQNGGQVPAIDGSGYITNSLAATTGTGSFQINGAKTFSGDIVDGAGDGKVAVTLSGGSGTWTLSGNNTYSGATTVTSGTLKAGSTTAFSPNSAYTIGAALDQAGYNNRIAGLTGGGTVKSSVGSATLTVNNDLATSNADYTFGGVLRDGTVGEGGGVLSLTKTGSKILTLSGANTFSGRSIVQAGTLMLVGTTTAPNAWAPVLTGAGGADIQGGKMVFNYTDTITPAATIQGLLTTSYAAGAWNTGQFKNATADASRGLGWADDGVDQVKVAYTFYGDATLDGTVDASDLAKVLANYNQLSGMVWSQGDFDYNATVDAGDLAKVLANYNQGPIVPGITALGLDAQAIQMLTAAGFSAVPEPSTLVLLAAGVLGLLCYAWRRRRS